MKKFLALCIVIILGPGCSSIPFKETEKAALRTADPRAVVERFKAEIPDDFRLLSSIVFEYSRFTVSGIGYVDINVREQLYKVACLNYMGVKLFEFEGNKDGLISQYAIGPLASRGNIAEAVGTDIRRVYFDLIPSPEARITRKKHEVVFRQRSGWGALEFTYAGAEGILVKKTYIEDNRAVWRVSYYEYQRKNGKLYPLGIIFTNYRYGYRLVVRQKEILG
jgi:hypothetical protein